MYGHIGWFEQKKVQLVKKEIQYEKGTVRKKGTAHLGVLHLFWRPRMRQK